MAEPPQFPPNKRPKTLISSPDPPSPMSKGKSKIDEGTSPPNHREIEDESVDCCGICLSERGDGGVSRGYIDSCSHNFCFVCIMEWAKVESRCPLCKRRFSTIRRPPKPPVFESERVVHVPLRDQAHHYFGNVTSGPSDPYTESKCSVCNGVEDESLLLLCDLCDCAAHTYCVGLGTTVPEGDWFCQDCTLLKDEQSRIETNAESGDQISSNPIPRPSSPDAEVSVYDIVQEHYSSSTTSNENGRVCTRIVGIGTENLMPPNARTLQHCRDLHGRIRLMRQSWNGFRNGILHFSSSPSDGNISRKKTMPRANERQSCPDQQSTAQCTSSQTTNSGRAEEIEKAWKMMDKATLLKQRLEMSTSNRDSKFPVRKLQSVQKTAPKNIGSIRQQQSHYDPRKDSCKQPSSVSRKRGTDDVSSRECSIIGHSSKFQVPESSNTIVKGIDHPSSSHSKLKQPMEKTESKKISVDNQKYSEAKSEIQSLVKLNLKLQTEKEKLEVNTFKEIARLATHAILAECGLEHPKPRSYSVQGFSCSHRDGTRVQKVSLMPNCCRECFYIYVKEMVNTILLQKKPTTKR
ncbi:autophagy-related protein 36-like [Andrographis paniculata]|uniref:autophagy-related protein 36-like n=1 Tax=Andrographis paniculata TaxID=175694 RepID=UPI0021E78FE1|nr:autophagy-related protein 36-like [Andrographis paniculata]